MKLLRGVTLNSLLHDLEQALEGKPAVSVRDDGALFPRRRAVAQRPSTSSASWQLTPALGREQPE
jgi:hypothetical protein